MRSELIEIAQGLTELLRVVFRYELNRLRFSVQIEGEKPMSETNWKVPALLGNQ
jgi:hypothetical protein